jgi:dTDP-glucose 4,6-dehydratase
MSLDKLSAEDLDHVLAHTRPLWEELRGSRLLVTGGTGFFGAWLLETFAHADEKLGLEAGAVVLSRDPAAFRRRLPHLGRCPAIAWRRGDVREGPLPEGTFSHVIHAATPSHAGRGGQTPWSLLTTIVEGTRRVLELARRCGAGKLLLTSSGAVYGKQPAELSHLPEDYGGSFTDKKSSTGILPVLPGHRLEACATPLDPGAAYGEGKRMAEQLAAQYAAQYGIEAKIARGFAFLGPHLPLDAHFAAGNFLRDGLGGGPIRVLGDGRTVRSYLYAADLAIWLWTILFRGVSCRPYNVGSDRALTIGELAETIAAAFDPRPEVTVAPPPDPLLPPDRYVPDIRRAEAELGLAVRIELAEACRRTILWLKS